MSSRPKILLTNDDGIEAPGIKSLWSVLHAADFADLYVIAPSIERSGAGVSITWDRPIQIRRRKWPADTPAWSVDGTPADCIKLGLGVILNEKPDLILSGINAGSNAGRNVLHSGTVGAVVEGIFRGIPGIAFSCENGSEPNFNVAEKYIIRIVEYIFHHPLPPGTLLNVNFPHGVKDQVKGFRLTRQGKGRWSEDPSLHLETDHGPSYWLGGKPEEFSEEHETDIALLREGYLTAVPIHVHEMTDYHELKNRQEAFSRFCSCEEINV